MQARKDVCHCLIFFSFWFDFVWRATHLTYPLLLLKLMRFTFLALYYFTTQLLDSSSARLNSIYCPFPCCCCRRLLLFIRLSAALSFFSACTFLFSFSLSF